MSAPGAAARRDREPVDDGNCFACGRDNPIGIHLHFADDEADGVLAHATLDPRLQGWRGIAHGGIVATLLDEGMAYAAARIGYRGVTAEMRLRFRRPVPTGEPIVIRGRLEWRRGKVCGVAARVLDETGSVLAEAQGRFVLRTALDPGERLGEPHGR